MKSYRFIVATIISWLEEYLQYDAAMTGYSQLSKFSKWFLNVGEPKHPKYHGVSLYRSLTCAMELRCYDGLFLSCRVGDKAYNLNLQTLDKTPLLGSRGMDIPESYERKIMQTVHYINSLIDTYVIPELLNK